MKTKLSVTLLFSVLILAFAIPNVNASSGYFAGQDCPMCASMSNSYGYRMAMPYYYPQPQYPWWVGYGAMSYPNFYYPGAWSGHGVNGGYYPGHGNGMVGKPNVYVSGKPGTKFKMRVRFNDDSNLLAAVPVHGDEGWSGQTLKGGRVQVDGAPYSYLFYDFRLDTDVFQAKAGFCASPEQLMPKLVDALKSSGFEKNEIKDFEQYWVVKLPPARRYCVYPQESKQLDEAAALEIEPKPATVTRLVFFIMTDEALAAGGRFGQPPTQEWTPGRAPAAAKSEGLAVREWGVGFPQGGR